MANVFQKFKNDIGAIFMLSTGIFILLSLATYSPKDPSFNSLSQGFKALNACGLVGSFISDLLFQFLGLSAWLFAGAFIKTAISGFYGKHLSLKSHNTIWAISMILVCSALLSLYFPEVRMYDHQILPGGILGWAFSAAMLKIFNSVGAQVILWTGMAIFSMLLLDRTTDELLPDEQFFKRKMQSLTGLLMKAIRVAKESFFLKEKKFKRQEDQNKNILPIFSIKKTEKIETGHPLHLEMQEEPQKQLQFEQIEPSPEESEIPGARRRVVLKAKPPRKIENWKMPSISLLVDPPASRVKMDRDELRRKAELLTEKLMKFRIEGTIVDAKPGPLVTMYEFKPNADVKISNISSLEDDLSLALSSESVRVMGQIPGTDVVGIETANSKRETVYYKDLLAEEKFWHPEVALPVALGKQGNGDPKIENLRSMPHLLIAGTTGSGKSVFMRSIISGLLFRHSPKTLRLLLIDPKMVDLADFRNVPHLILPHITEPKKAVTALRWAVREMDKRYRSLSKFGAAKIEGFNERVLKLSKEEIAEHEQKNTEAETTPASGDTYYFQPLPFIVVIVDELADLMVVEKQNVEPSIQRLAQKARACGIHLIFATQTPRKEVVTGLIKSNFPGRVALKVSSPLDSRIILEETGAERLLPNGDMLFLAPGVNKPARHHGPYLSDKEIENVVQFWSDQAQPEYDSVGLQMLEGPAAAPGDHLSGVFSEDDAGEEYDHIVRWTTEQKTVSASMLQRRFQIGYPKAARFIELMESSGLVSCANGSKPRQVLAGPLK